MPYEIASAAGHYDLLAKIKDFASTNNDLVTAGQAWSVLRYDTSGDDHELILKGPGLSGTEEIFIGFKTYQNPDADYYNFKVAGFTGYVSGNSFESQPGSSPQLGVPLWNQATPYWLVVNGRRIVLAAKVSTVYETCYLGKFLPYATPHQYPYPMYVGGMLKDAAATRWADTAHSMPYKGSEDTNSSAQRPQSRMRFVDGDWRTPMCWPWSNWFNNKNRFQMRDTGGEYGLLPIVLHSPTNFNLPSTQDHVGVYGELDGVRHATGFNNAVENAITIDGTDHVVIQDVYRTGFNDYFALELS